MSEHVDKNVDSAEALNIEKGNPFLNERGVRGENMTA